VHALRHADAEVLLIDRRNHHIFQPLLYQVATAVLSPAEIAAPIRQLEAKQRNVSVLLAEVTRVDVASRMIEASSPGVGVRKLPFDYLIVATGMRPSYFGHDEFARHAPGLKNLNDAETIRAKILGAFELAVTTEDEGERARQMTFVLVGAGPTGVELAALYLRRSHSLLPGSGIPWRAAVRPQAGAAMGACLCGSYGRARHIVLFVLDPGGQQLDADTGRL
jgi:NADH:ubiquinone reductase (H+-translocating)